VPRSIFGFARDKTDGSRVMTQVKNAHGRDDLPSLGYKIETTQLYVVRGVATCFLLEQANMVAPAIADLVSQ
jgi:hypothetical protein